MLCNSITPYLPQWNVGFQVEIERHVVRLSLKGGVGLNSWVFLGQDYKNMNHATLSLMLFTSKMQIVSIH